MKSRSPFLKHKNKRGPRAYFSLLQQKLFHSSFPPSFTSGVMNTHGKILPVVSNDIFCLLSREDVKSLF